VSAAGLRDCLSLTPLSLIFYDMTHLYCILPLIHIIRHDSLVLSGVTQICHSSLVACSTSLVACFTSLVASFNDMYPTRRTLKHMQRTMTHTAMTHTATHTSLYTHTQATFTSLDTHTL